MKPKEIIIYATIIIVFVVFLISLITFSVCFYINSNKSKQKALNKPDTQKTAEIQQNKTSDPSSERLIGMNKTLEQVENFIVNNNN